MTGYSQDFVVRKPGGCRHGLLPLLRATKGTDFARICRRVAYGVAT